MFSGHINYVNLSNDFNNEIERTVDNKDNELGKKGMYPKNQQILSKAVSKANVYRLWKFSPFCDINDIEFLLDSNMPFEITREIVRYMSLSFEHIVSLIQNYPELRIYDFNTNRMIRRTYEVIYQLYKNDHVPLFAYIKPKNSKELEFFNKIPNKSYVIKITGHLRASIKIMYTYLTLL